MRKHVLIILSILGVQAFAQAQSIPCTAPGALTAARPKLEKGYGFCEALTCQTPQYDAEPVSGKCVKAASASWFSKDQKLDTANLTLSLKAKNSRMKAMQVPVTACPSSATQGLDFSLATTQATFSSSSLISESININLLRPNADRPEREVVLALGNDCASAPKVTITLSEVATTKPSVDLAFTSSEVIAGESVGVFAQSDKVVSQKFATIIKATVGTQTVTLTIPKGQKMSQTALIATSADQAGSTLEASLSGMPSAVKPGSGAMIAVNAPEAPVEVGPILLTPLVSNQVTIEESNASILSYTKLGSTDFITYLENMMNFDDPTKYRVKAKMANGEMISIAQGHTEPYPVEGYDVSEIRYINPGVSKINGSSSVALLRMDRELYQANGGGTNSEYPGKSIAFLTESGTTTFTKDPVVLSDFGFKEFHQIGDKVYGVYADYSPSQDPQFSLRKIDPATGEETVLLPTQGFYAPGIKGVKDLGNGKAAIKIFHGYGYGYTMVVISNGAIVGTLDVENSADFDTGLMDGGSLFFAEENQLKAIDLTASTLSTQTLGTLDKMIPGESVAGILKKDSSHIYAVGVRIDSTVDVMLHKLSIATQMEDGDPEVISSTPNQDMAYTEVRNLTNGENGTKHMLVLNDKNIAHIRFAQGELTPTITTITDSGNPVISPYETMVRMLENGEMLVIRGYNDATREQFPVLLASGTKNPVLLMTEAVNVALSEAILWSGRMDFPAVHGDSLFLPIWMQGTNYDLYKVKVK